MATTEFDQSMSFDDLNSDAGMTRLAFFEQALLQMGYAPSALSGQYGITRELRKADPQRVFELAKQAGLTTATSFDEFRGDDVITRGEAATVLVRSTGQEVGSTQEGLQAAVDLGLFQSVGDGSAEFLNRWFEDVLGRGEGVLPTPPENLEDAIGALEDPLGLVDVPAVSEPAVSEPAGGTTAGDDPIAETVTDDPNVNDPNELNTEQRNALEIIRDKLSEYGLSGLDDFAKNALLRGDTTEVVLMNLRDTNQFQERFAGMQIRRDNGMSAISPAEYIRLERGYRQVMMAAGIPEGFYDAPDDFAAFIGNDVSQAEMTERVAMAATAVQSIDPNLKTQLQDLYGIGVENDGELTAYFLDPERGTSLIEQRLQMEAAGLSAAAVGTLGAGFERQTAERLADLNVQQREITERLKGQRAVTQQLVGEQEAMTTSEFAAAEFGLDSEATADLARLRRQRQERGRRQMGALVTGAGASGLGRAT